MHCHSVSRCLIKCDCYSQNITKILKLDLRFGSSGLEVLATLPTPSSIYKVAAIESTSQVLVFSHSSTIRYLHWPSLTLWTMSVTEEEDEELVCGAFLS